MAEISQEHTYNVEKLCKPNATGEAILCRGIEVKIHQDHPEITATIIEAIIEGYVKPIKNEKIHDSELEFRRSRNDRSDISRNY